MSRIKYIVPLLYFSLFMEASSAQEGVSGLDVFINNTRNDKGLIRLGLYDHPDQFPHEPLGSYDISKEPLSNGCLKFTISDLSPGIYAVSILDDENGDDKMNYNLLLMPKEGFGFSNNVKPRFKSPDFEDCLFEMAEGRNEITINFIYFRDKGQEDTTVQQSSADEK